MLEFDTSHAADATQKQIILMNSMMKTAEKFLYGCNVQDSISLVIADNRERFYEREFNKKIPDVERNARVKGEFITGYNILAIYADEYSNLPTNSKYSLQEDWYKTIRHELLGHYGLSTFTLEEKGAFLEEIYKTRNSLDKRIQKRWEEIDSDYEGDSPSRKAEEFFAKIAEDPEAFKSKAMERVLELLIIMLTKLGLVEKTITLKELHEEATKLAQGIQEGRRMITEPDVWAMADVLDENGKSKYAKPDQQNTNEQSKKLKLK